MAKLGRQKRNLQAIQKPLLLVCFVLFVSSVVAQNEGQYTHFMFNRLSYNPAYAGSSCNISGTVLYRSQWLGLTLQAPTSDGDAGSKPSDILFTFDMPVSWLHGGIGLNFTSEKIGYHDNTAIGLDYAFRIFWGAGTLAAGVEASLLSCAFKTSSLIGPDDLPGNPTAGAGGSSDPLVSNQDASDFLIDMSTGLYYQVPGLYYIGLSAKNLLAAKSDKINIHNTRTFYLIGGYEYTFPYNPSFKIKPSALIKSGNFSTFQADLACLLDYENIFWAGLSYRPADAVNFLAGVNFAKIMQVGVAYDLTTSKLGFGSGRSFGSVEFYINAAFQITIPKRPPTVSGNTLYLR